VNGVLKCNSPLLVEKAPLGPLRIEAEKGNLYDLSEMEPNEEELLKVRVSLNQQLGRLFLRTPERDLLVILDREVLGLTGDGLFPDIPDGKLLLELSGNGVFSEMEITVSPNETTVVDADLRDVGNLLYRIPDGAAASIAGEDCSKVFSGEWLD